MSHQKVRITHATTGEAAIWLQKASRVLPEWKEDRLSMPAMPEMLLRYPFKEPNVPGIKFLGVQECTFELKSKDIAGIMVTAQMSNVVKMMNRLKLPNAAILCYAVRKTEIEKTQVLLQVRHDKGGFYYVIAPGAKWLRPAEDQGLFAGVLQAIGVAVTPSPSEDGLDFVCSGQASVKVAYRKGERQPTEIQVRDPNCSPLDVLERMIGWLRSSGITMQRMTLFFYFGLPPEAEMDNLQTVNSLGLPVDSGRCGFYAVPKSIADVGALIKLEKLNHEPSTIDQSIATFRTPKGAIGSVYIVVDKKGLVTEIHPPNTHDEWEFVKEVKSLIKNIPA